ADARVDIAERLQPEQRGGVVGIVEDEGCGLIDRRDARAGGRIGLCTGMHGKGRKSGNTIVHASSLSRGIVRRSGEPTRRSRRRGGEGTPPLDKGDNRVRKNRRQGDFASLGAPLPLRNDRAGIAANPKQSSGG